MAPPNGLDSSGTVTVNDLKFTYYEAGSGPLALCLHGFPDTAHTWRYLLPALAEAGYRAVAPFMRGYAPTQVPADGAYQTGALVSDAIGLHEALGGDGDAVIIGHDWGGYATYGAVAFAPERWRKAVVLAVPPVAAMATSFFDYAQLKRSFYIFLFQTGLAEMALGADDLAFVDGLWRDWSPGYNGAADVAKVKESLREPANQQAAIGYYRALFDPSVHVARYEAEQQAAAAGPANVATLYLHGIQDGCLGASLIGDVPAYLPPGSDMSLVDDAGHFLHVERPDVVNTRILEWLAT